MQGFKQFKIADLNEKFILRFQPKFQLSENRKSNNREEQKVSGPSNTP